MEVTRKGLEVKDRPFDFAGYETVSDIIDTGTTIPLNGRSEETYRPHRWEY